MITRELGKVLRGKATPFQLGAACILGAMLGFVPGVVEGPGIAAVAIGLALVIVNANLLLSGLIAGACKVLSLATMPIAFGLGRIVLDGPLQGTMKSAINAPVLAWLGLDYYATTGGLVLGLIAGIILAGFVIVVVGAFRAKMAKVEEGSELYKKYSGKLWVRILVWLILGKGKGKKSYAELSRKKIGNPIRPLGVVFVAVVLGFGYLIWAFQNEWIVRSAAQRAMETANGATVDIASAKLDLASGELRLMGLAAADIDDLRKDRLRAKEAAAKLGTRDLLRKRLVIDTLELFEASTGEPRIIPGRRLRSLPKPKPPRGPDDGPSLDDYLKDAAVWRERLETASEWLEQVAKRLPEEEPSTGEPAPKRETLPERLAREVRELGYPNVRAWHLVEGSPMILVKEFRATGLKSAEAGQVDVLASNISSQPWLVDEPPRLRVQVAKGRFVDVSLDSLARGATTAGGPAAGNAMKFRYTAIEADRVAGLLKASGQPPIQGGTVDLFCERGRCGLSGDGEVVVNLPVAIVVRNTTVTIEGAGSAPVEKMAFPVQVRGTLSDPTITINQESLAKALADAGAAALANKVRERTDAAIDRAKGKLDEKLKEELGDIPIDLGPATDVLDDAAGDAAGDLIGGFLGGGREKKNKEEPK